MATLTAEDIAFAHSLVIYEDAQLIAFNKPSGLSSQGGRIKAATLDDLMGAFASGGGNRPRLVHRLDRDTSGVIVAARTKPAAGFLGKAMMARKVHKTYLALVSPGAPSPPQGTIDAPLRREEIGRESYMRVCGPHEDDAQAAQTLYRSLASSDLAALIEARPKTGRMHQIRVHLAHIGAPIVGDVRYGGALMVGGAAVSRLMLHALALEFPHPAGGRTRVEAPPPADFAAAVCACALSDSSAWGRIMARDKVENF
jgi:RluA family pseudouridine synthase